MNIVKRLDQYDDNCVYFCEPIKNNIMNDGYFIRIIYSTPLFMLNGIYIAININHITIEKYYNKLYRVIEARFYNLFDAYEFKRIFDMPYTKDKSFVFSKRFMEKILLYDNK